ncbi:MAG: 3-hydroxyacyl-ACP dehydratase FabZ family protein [Planctomycetota bacterium]|jgi:3-hydroxyacyl-[acyl-carrier-protein] dehydratase
MRWIWIDKFLEFKSGESAVALKNVSLAEEHLHDHFPGFPMMPECLMIEAMAQTAGILAKVKKAAFYHFVRPGDTITLHARIESIAPEAASTTGEIMRGDERIAQISMMFSHIDNNLAGKEFPEENFVFTDMFNSLLTGFVENKSATEQTE